jgi:mannose-6-phosphate isomerase-like protein (cupin superfamily)
MPPYAVHKSQAEQLPIQGDAPRTLFIALEPENCGSRQFAMGMQTVDPGSSIPLHRHHNEEEILFIYHGTARVTVGDDTFDTAPETAVFIPRGVLHGLVNTGDSELRLTWTFSPPGFQHNMRALARDNRPYPT